MTGLSSNDTSGTSSHLQGKNALVLITGIGRALAVRLSKLFCDTDSAFLLMARDRRALDELRLEILRETLSTTVEVLPMDLSEPLRSVAIEETIKKLEAKKRFNVRIVVHNAGTLGDMSRKAGDSAWDEAQWHDYLQTNLVSMVALNSRVYDVLSKKREHVEEKDDSYTLTFFVNITSMLAVKPFPSFTQYSVGKAAREAYFRSFALEHPDCRVLSYSPGPVETAMLAEAARESYDPEVREMFQLKRTDERSKELVRRPLRPEETVERLIGLLQANRFKSGTRIDFFDDDDMNADMTSENGYDSV